MLPHPALLPFSHTLRLPQFRPAPELLLHLYRALDIAPGIRPSLDKPPLLLIHGLGDEADSWRQVFAPLAGYFSVFAPDLPGFGRSSSPQLVYTLEFHTAALLALLDELGLEQVALVGSSLGGTLAHKLALEHPQRVSHLVLVDGSLVYRSSQRLGGRLLLSLLPGVGELLYTRLRNDPNAAYETMRPYYADLDALPEADRAFLLARVQQRVWSDSQKRAYFSTLRHLTLAIGRLQAGLDAQLAQSASSAPPTLVIWGEHDRINPVENAHLTAAALRTAGQQNVHLSILQGAGHLPHQEQPALFVEHIVKFIQP